MLDTKYILSEGESKHKAKLVLLPGLDGTGNLFEPLLTVLPSYLEPCIISYPTESVLGYKDLQFYIMGKLPRTKRFVLLAESFSGPIALNIAATKQQNLLALILVATFVQNPFGILPCGFNSIVSSLLFRLPFPRQFVRKFLMGNNTPDEFIQTFFDALKLVNPKVLANRLHSALNVDARQALLNCSVPILYLFATQDKLVTKRSLRIILKLNPNVKNVSINAPHMLLQCAPTLASNAIIDFLQLIWKDSN